jgi:aspartyl-tRNA(Asn)/glutamyl-tRNA(Gln) amidotransferase subunit B
MFTITGKTGEWEVVIGLETHAEITSHSKLMGGASADYNPTVAPNTQVSFGDAAMPGMPPVLNARCVDQAIKFGLAINAEISRKSIFARKQYFYPDLPSGYQISQPAEEPPVVGRGWVEIIGDNGVPKKIFIERAHLEQDAGKNKHDAHPTKSFVDLNRLGVGLLEIVTFLDVKNPANNSFITSPDEAEKYLREIQSILRATGVGNANMDEGSMRADVNVSVRRAGSGEFGERCEIKNMVSFKFIKTAIEYEALRQIEILEDGGKIKRCTMHFNQNTGKTSIMREKESAADYRYFPEPDLQPLVITEEHIERVRATMPEMPAAKRTRYVKDMGLNEYDAARLTEDTITSVWFEEAVGDKPARAKPIANWMISELFAHPENWDNKLGVRSEELGVRSEESGVNRACNDTSVSKQEQLTPDSSLLTPNSSLLTPNSPRQITPADLRELVDMIDNGEVSGKMAKDIFFMMLDGDVLSPAAIASRDGLKQVSDANAIAAIIDEIVAANPSQTEEYKGGKTGLFGFFVGQVMKKSGGAANPAAVNEILKKKLG